MADDITRRNVLMGLGALAGAGAVVGALPRGRRPQRSRPLPTRRRR